MKIQPVVEGHGEVLAVPELLRRLLTEAGSHGLEVGRPIRRKRSELIQEGPLKKSIRLAMIQPDCGAVLVVFDSDDACPKTLGPCLESWARQEAGSIPCAIVMAHREYEAWFLATIESLRGKRGIKCGATYAGDPEMPRGAKEKLEELMEASTSYSETTDQVALTAQFDMGRAYERSRSFRRLIKAFGVLVSGVGAPMHPWPPPAWLRGND